MKPKPNPQFGLGFSIITWKTRMKWIYETNEDNSARFVPGQVFNENEKTLFCLGINPSTACPSCLDNTIRKVIKISKYNGYDNWIMLNTLGEFAGR